MAEGTHVTPMDLDIALSTVPGDDGSISFKVNQQRIETDLIMKAFTLSQGNLSRAAQELGISRSTLYRRLRQYGMDRTLDRLRELGAASVRELHGEPEDMVFALPKELRLRLVD